MSKLTRIRRRLDYSENPTVKGCFLTCVVAQDRTNNGIIRKPWEKVSASHQRNTHNKPL